MKREDIAEAGVGSTTRLEITSTPKLLNRFASTSAKNSAMELLGLKNLIEVESWGLLDTIREEERKLSGVIEVEKRGLFSILGIKR